MSGRRAAAACCTVVLCTWPAFAAPPAQASKLAPVDGYGRLSDEVRVSYWAHPVRAAKVRVRPVYTARVVTRLHLATELGSPETYLVLSRRRDVTEDDAAGILRDSLELW